MRRRPAPISNAIWIIEVSSEDLCLDADVNLHAGMDSRNHQLDDEPGD